MSRPALRGGPSTAAPGDGSRTVTITNDPTRELGEHDEGSGDEEGERRVVGSIRLRGGRRRTQAHVVWDEAVVDNEGCGKKKSKICCIYHKPRRFDESSSDESSDSEPDSDNDDRARPTNSHRHGHGHAHNHPHPHPHQPNGGPNSSQRDAASGSGVVHELHSEDEYELNAYEKQPAPHKGKGKRRAA